MNEGKHDLKLKKILFFCILLMGIIIIMMLMHTSYIEGVLLFATFLMFMFFMEAIW